LPAGIIPLWFLIMKKILLLTVVLLPLCLQAQKDSTFLSYGFTMPDSSPLILHSPHINTRIQNNIFSISHPKVSHSLNPIPRNSILPFQNYRIPVRDNFSQTGVLYSWDHVSFTGSNSHTDAPFLLVGRHASAGLKADIGNLSISVNALANNYFRMESGSFNQFGIDAKLKYNISNITTMTVFGELYNHNPYSSLAEYPFLSASKFGGYMTLMGDRVGIDVGAEHYFDPARNRWETAPIITPKIRIVSNLYFEIRVGRLISNGFQSPMPNTPTSQNTPKNNRRF